MFLWGFSGSGKSTLLNRMRENNSGFELLDMDEIVAGRQGVVSFVEKNGWRVFREREETTLRYLCGFKDKKRVIALGGGSLNDVILPSLNFCGISIWLDTPFEECYKRIKNSPDRPLAGKGKAFLKKLYMGRLLLYRQAALRLTLRGQQRVCSPEDLIHMVKEGGFFGLNPD